jgi:hypothetical protein
VIVLVRIVLTLVGLFFLLAGLRFVFTPDAIAAQFHVAPVGLAGLSTLRGDFGGAFLAIAAFVGMGLRPGGTRWLHAASLVLALIAAGRVVGFVVDGVAPDTLVPFVVELVFVGLLLIGARRLQVR